MTMRFSALHLENWRNFRHVDVALQRRAFVVGPNASGKSNLLDAFRFLRDIASVGGGFQDAVARRGSTSSIRCLAARRSPDIAIAVSLGTRDNDDEWRYELVFGGSRGDAFVKTERVWRAGELVLDRPDDKDTADVERLSQTALEQVTANKEFRQVQELFASVRYLHVVPQLVREPDRSRGMKNDPYGGDLLEQIARTPQRTREARLGHIKKALKVAMPQLSDLKLEADPRGDWHLKGKYEHWRPPGAWQPETDFSDGTLRLLGLLWALLDGTGPLLLEEPELSLHPEVVRFLPQLFARAQRKSSAQILVSTHSADLLRDSGIGLDEILLLEPTENGTGVRLASSIDEAQTLLAHGATPADLVMPRTRPREVDQLALFEA